MNGSWMNSNSIASAVMGAWPFNQVFVCIRWSEVKNLERISRHPDSLLGIERQTLWSESYLCVNMWLWFVRPNLSAPCARVQTGSLETAIACESVTTSKANRSGHVDVASVRAWLCETFFFLFFWVCMYVHFIFCLLMFQPSSRGGRRVSFIKWRKEKKKKSIFLDYFLSCELLRDKWLSPFLSLV